MNNYLKSFDISSTSNLQLFVLSFVLSIPAIVLGENILFALPVLIVVMMSFIFGERFIIAFIIISLFTLVGELNRSLRTSSPASRFYIAGYFIFKAIWTKISIPIHEFQNQ